MINYIKGEIVEKEPTHVIIDVNGIGYLIKISLNTYSLIRDSESAKLLTYFHVKEDSQTLFGFKAIEEKELFMLLISISGVGPGTGLMILSSLTPVEIQKAILNDDVATMQNIKGIGTKTAQRIILELKDKMAKFGALDESSEIFPQLDNTLRNEALSALITLGINRPMAEKSIALVLKNSGDNITLEELIKLSLKTS